MKISGMVEWLEGEFGPVGRAADNDTMTQCFENAIRYWNTHSGFRVAKMFNAGVAKYVEIDAEYKSVVEVLPAASAQAIFRDQSIWSLLGFRVIDNLTNDLILLTETYKNYQYYTGTDFRWQFERNTDPEGTSKLYFSNKPQGSTTIYVAGTKRVLPQEDVKNEYILDWLLNYGKSLFKMVEGNALRKSDIIGIRNDGQVQYDEGKAEKERLEDTLKVDGRWVALVSRF